MLALSLINKIYRLGCCKGDIGSIVNENSFISLRMLNKSSGISSVRLVNVSYSKKISYHLIAS